MSKRERRNGSDLIRYLSLERVYKYSLTITPPLSPPLVGGEGAQVGGEDLVGKGAPHAVRHLLLQARLQQRKQPAHRPARHHPRLCR